MTAIFFGWQSFVAMIISGTCWQTVSATSISRHGDDSDDISEPVGVETQGCHKPPPKLCACPYADMFLLTQTTFCPTPRHPAPWFDVFHRCPRGAGVDLGLCLVESLSSPPRAFLWIEIAYRVFFLTMPKIFLLFSKFFVRVRLIFSIFVDWLTGSKFSSTASVAAFV